MMLEMDPILRPDFSALKRMAIDKVFLEESDFFSVDKNNFFQSKQISIDLNRHKFDGLGRMK